MRDFFASRAPKWQRSINSSKKKKIFYARRLKGWKYIYGKIIVLDNTMSAEEDDVCITCIAGYKT